MNLKKDIQEQAAQLKSMQEQIVQLTFERDAARAESKKLRAIVKDGSSSASTSTVAAPVLTASATSALALARLRSKTLAASSAGASISPTNENVPNAATARSSEPADI
jgi:regulator of replication initiation timing